ncbi:MAG: DUF4159 domain-containing protein [Phycisphaerales bacterium]|nr:DUF4159 domain-containing protein [Phycisphaerales bacterium]
MNRTAHPLLFPALLAACLLPQAAYAAAPKDIDATIAKAVNYLYSQQKNGNWEIAPQPKPGFQNFITNKLDEGNWGGLTGLAVNALLAAGENPHSPKLKPAIDFLTNAPMRAPCPYALCQRDQVLAQLTSTPDLQKIFRLDGNTLLRIMETQGDGAGFYAYSRDQQKPFYDHSVSQFGVLAMWTCGENGFEVPNNYWPIVERAWINHQDTSGGWSYVHKGKAGEGLISASMTAAGVATLFITQDYVHSDEGITPKGNITNPAIDRGMKWLAENFPSTLNSGPFIPNGQYYNLYGIERCGVASGYKYFGSHNWYQEIADWILKQQRPDGGFGQPSDIYNNNTNLIPNTAFAILFLTRGREPVLMNKLAYSTKLGLKTEEGHWNQRTRDVANVARWIGKQSEHTFNWQIVNLATTPLEDLHDAPILFIAGDQTLDFTPDQDAKLRQYVLEGGLILCNPDGSSGPIFTKSFQRLGARLFPTYEMRTLPATHPIYTSEQFRGPQFSRRPILAISNGARELMICTATDFAKSWQSRAYATDDAFRNTANIFFYITGGKNLRKKGETHIVRPNPAVKPEKNIKLARLDYSGNSDPEPAGWQRLAAIMHNDDKIDLLIDTVKLGENKLTDYKLAHLTGTAPFSLSDAQRSELAKFLQTGGTLFIDAAGGSYPFADSATAELTKILPNDANQLEQLIPFADPLYQNPTTSLTFDMRTWALRERLAKNGPQLRAIRQNNRIIVLFSREDISNALVGIPSDGVIGYTPDSATTLTRHLLKPFAK